MKIGYIIGGGILWAMLVMLYVYRPWKKRGKSGVNGKGVEDVIYRKTGGNENEKPAVQGKKKDKNIISEIKNIIEITTKEEF